MSEEYRFMRYYLPGSLFIIYMIILVMVNLPAPTVKSLSQQAIIGIFTGAFVASPTIGYLIYAFYNQLYERYWAKDSAKRPALKYIENKFIKYIEDQHQFTNETKAYLKKKLRCFIQKKEFLDLIYHSSLNDGEIKIDPKILETLKNHVSAFAARIVCGFFVPLFCIPSFLIIWIMLALINIDLTLNIIPFLTSVMVILVLSVVLLLDSDRVIREAYQLEEYMVRAKSEEIEKLLEKLFPR